MRRGTLYGAAAYGIWGTFPLYFAAMAPAGPVEVVLHRVVWSALVCLSVVAVTRAWRELRHAMRPRTLLGLTAAAVLIALNWGVYVYGVTSEQVVETSLGYFINPVVTVLLGVLVLRERLRGLQWAAVAIGLVAVAVLTVDYGRPPWIALVLASSFGLYGLLKNRVGRGVGALTSLTVETVVLVPVAVVGLVLLEASGSGTWTREGPGHALLLASTGVATAVPLLLFAAAARRVPLSTIGLLQYLTPVLQLLAGVVVLGEHMPASRWVGFGIVWLALAVLTVDMLRTARRRSASRTTDTVEAASSVR